MDLREARAAAGGGRHPWELARAAAIRTLLAARPLARDARVLDVGCGDGYLARQLFGAHNAALVVGLDPALDEPQQRELARVGPPFRFLRRWEELPAQAFDLVLMLDVLEHVEDDAALLRRAGALLAPGGTLLLTVPAFQALFGAHDRFLGHQRRYRRQQAAQLARRAALQTAGSGYLFGSLLLPRALETLSERYRPRAPRGLGGWRRGPLLSRLITLALRGDNALLLSLARRGVIVPGLSAWVLCSKPPP